MSSSGFRKPSVGQIILYGFTALCVLSVFTSPSPIKTFFNLLIMWLVIYTGIKIWGLFTEKRGSIMERLMRVEERETRKTQPSNTVLEETVNGSSKAKQLTLDEESYLLYLQDEYYRETFDPPISLEPKNRYLRKWLGLYPLPKKERKWGKRRKQQQFNDELS